MNYWAAWTSENVYMAELRDVIMEAVISTFSEKIDEKVLRNADTPDFRRKLLKKLTNEVFYLLLTEGKVDLVRGFGSVIAKQIKEKYKKIYYRTTGDLVTRHVRGRKIVYKPGDTLREFL